MQHNASICRSLMFWPSREAVYDVWSTKDDIYIFKHLCLLLFLLRDRGSPFLFLLLYTIWGSQRVFISFLLCFQWIIHSFLSSCLFSFHLTVLISILVPFLVYCTSLPLLPMFPIFLFLTYPLSSSLSLTFSLSSDCSNGKPWDQYQSFA